jgi:hypothetical protein
MICEAPVAGAGGRRPVRSSLRFLIKLGLFPFRFAWLLILWLGLRRRIRS